MKLPMNSSPILKEKNNHQHSMPTFKSMLTACFLCLLLWWHSFLKMILVHPMCTNVILLLFLSSNFAFYVARHDASLCHVLTNKGKHGHLNTTSHDSSMAWEGCDFFPSVLPFCITKILQMFYANSNYLSSQLFALKLFLSVFFFTDEINVVLCIYIH